MHKDNRIQNTAEHVKTADGALEMLTALVTRPRNAIEDQEARGQEQLVNSAVLPVKGTSTEQERAQWTAVGAVLGDVVPDDDLFRYATLPPGWTKVATQHSMGSEIRDERGRVRAMVFYKAAFYDRRADVRLCPRFRVDYREIDESLPFGESPVVGVVLDAGMEIWASEETPGECADHENNWTDGAARACELARDWLVSQGRENYRDPTAYWSE